MKIIYYLGIPGTENPKFPIPTKPEQKGNIVWNFEEGEGYDKALSLALSNRIEFDKEEDREKVRNFILKDIAIENGCIGFNPDMPIGDGIYEVEGLEAETVEVRLVVGHDEYKNKPIIENRLSSRLISGKKEEPKCGQCGHELTLVRPGKHQCDNPDCEQNKVKQEPASEDGKGQAFIPHQLCPKCYGTGLLSRPPYIPGDVTRWDQITTGPFTCNLCNGSKTIPMIKATKPTEDTEGKQPISATTDYTEARLNKAILNAEKVLAGHPSGDAKEQEELWQELQELKDEQWESNNLITNYGRRIVSQAKEIQELKDKLAEAELKIGTTDQIAKVIIERETSFLKAKVERLTAALIQIDNENSNRWIQWKIEEVLKGIA